MALQQSFPSTAFRINLPLQKTNLLVLSLLITEPLASRAQIGEPLRAVQQPSKAFPLARVFLVRSGPEEEKDFFLNSTGQEVTVLLSGDRCCFHDSVWLPSPISFRVPSRIWV